MSGIPPVKTPVRGVRGTDSHAVSGVVGTSSLCLHPDAHEFLPWGCRLGVPCTLLPNSRGSDRTTRNPSSVLPLLSLTVPAPADWYRDPYRSTQKKTKTKKKPKGVGVLFILSVLHRTREGRPNHLSQGEPVLV